MNLQRHHHTPPITEHLRDIPLFAGCTNRELQEIAGLTTEVTLPTGKVLCHQGEAGREAFLILDGEACVETDGTELARLGRGAVCGELALLDGGTRSATVTAVTPMRVLVMSVADFADLTSRPNVSRRILATLAGRLRLTNGRR
ncbi:MAG: Crp/Fnr family transcriptional regulator [Microthrixaceae bacterium]